MAPVATAAGAQISAVTLDLILSPDFMVEVCPVTSVYQWVLDKSLISVCLAFSSYKDWSEDFKFIICWS